MNEKEVRILRDKVYGSPISENEWENCKHNWMKPKNIEWLKKKSKTPLCH